MPGKQGRPMRLAITTRFRGATESHGSRVLASCSAGRIHVAWDHALDPEANHTRAAHALAARLGWSGHWHGGSTPQGYVYVWRGIPADPDFTTDYGPGTRPIASPGRC